MEVGWHLRLSRDDELVFLVQPQLAPNVEDAVFIAGGWELVWDKADEDAGFVTALARRKR
jgi:hypothetical protein